MTTELSQLADTNEQLSHYPKWPVVLPATVIFISAVVVALPYLTLKWAALGLGGLFLSVCCGVFFVISLGRHDQGAPGYELHGYISMIALWAIASVWALGFGLSGKNGWYLWGVLCVATFITTITLLITNVWLSDGTSRSNRERQ